MVSSRPGITKALLLLSLFTSVERAREIEGDLIEEEGSKGHLHYGFQVVTTTLALMRRSIATEFPLVVLLGFAGYQLALRYDAELIMPIREFLWLRLEYGGLLVWAVTYLSWFLSTFLYGLLLALLLGALGPRAALATAAALLVKLSLLNIFVSWPIAVLQALTYVVLPLLFGAIGARYIHLKWQSGHKGTS